jgi:hypothetical protein
MRKGTTLAATTLLAAGILLGHLVIPTVGQEKKAKPGANTVSRFTAAQLAERTLRRRAVEAVIWGVPAVNFDLMYQAMVRDAKAGVGSNRIVYWSKLSD